MFKFRIYSPVLFLVAFLALIQTTEAAEIQYGHIEEVHNTELHIQYRGPGGQQNFVCDLLAIRTGSSCQVFGTGTPQLFPAIGEDTNYPKSLSGRYGVIEEETTVGFRYTLYDISGQVAVLKAVLPYSRKTNDYKFSRDDNHLILFADDAPGTVSVYNIVTGVITDIIPSQLEFPLLSRSPRAGYISAYNYIDKAHKIWDTKTGAEINIPASIPALVEFSESERYATWVDDFDGYKTIYLADLHSGKQNAQRVFSDDFTVEDYLWFKDKLYVIGNTEENPYRWVLYQYDPSTEEIKIVAENVSYGDYIRPISDYALSFLVIEGKNSHIALYNAEEDRTDIIRLVADSPASEEIDRSIISFSDGAMGVLYEPKDPGRRADLFVWLHGGPKRQTSFGYHSYLSYAVYDELLEKLTESGAYVLKLDYAGSYGHGSEFMNQLDTRLGVVDVKTVIDATEEIKSDYRIDDVYLLGNSYGGYLGPKALVTKDRLFDGAIAINGVFDWFDLLSRIPSSPFKTYFNGLANLEDLRENFNLYENASVVKDLPDLNRRKKLLLIYGEDDGTVPVWQTREFFYQAKILDKDVKLLKLEGERHIIRERASLNLLCEFIADNLPVRDLQCG